MNKKNVSAVDWFETLNNKELTKAELIQQEIKENLLYNLYDDTFILL